MRHSNKQRKVYAGVLAAVAGAWAVDRFVLDAGLSSPGTASAASTASHQPSPPIAPAGAKASANPSGTPGQSDRLVQPSLSQRLADLQESIDEDVFANQELFEKPHWISVRPAAAKTEVPVIDEEEAFLAANKLTTVITSAKAEAARAVFNGVPLTVGNELAGYRITKITKDAVTFERDGKRIEYPVPNRKMKDE